ncbi:MAG TPA: nitrilase-related carbon-nitrogen hydrolase [bacterium]|nr:nitrilase-related carbon-nitrogen hydrolase [bacterium]
MRLAFAQFAPVFGDVEENVSQALGLAEGVDAELYVFPELFATGYQFRDRQELQLLAEPAAGGPTLDRMAAWCRERGAFACAGWPEADGEAVYNSAFLIGPNGLRGVYRKTHLFWREKDLFDVPGDDTFEVYDIGPARVGMMICFDWIFPEVARILALHGAQVILHPANLVLPHCPAAMVTRCLENRVFAITAGRTGTEDRWEEAMTFIGGSQIVNPGGEVLIRLEDEDAAVAIDVNPAEADDKFVTPRNDVFADRRVELYSDLLKPK